MKELYSIGEVAEILNISTQTLRYYDKIGLLQPAYTDPRTGYRKYIYDQVSYADRIRYLQNLGLNLDEIRAALQHNDVGLLTGSLAEKEAQIEDEIRAREATLQELQWYRSYYDYIRKYSKLGHLPFTSQKTARYLLAEPLQGGDGVYGIGHRLLRRKNSDAFKNLAYHRQNGYLLDYEKLLQGVFQPTHYWVLLRDPPAAPSPYIHCVPAGTYFCLRMKLLSDGPPPSRIIQDYLGAQPAPPLVVAPEYETNFLDFKDCPYEIQILMEQETPL